LLDVRRAILGGNIQAATVAANGFEQGAGARPMDRFGGGATAGGDHHGEAIRLRLGGGARRDRVQDAEQ
jgi:hypothetical protein